MKKILIVDDEPIMQKLAERALCTQYKVVMASSGEEALEMIVYGFTVPVGTWKTSSRRAKTALTLRQSAAIP